MIKHMYDVDCETCKMYGECICWVDIEDLDGPSDKEIDRAQSRLERLFGKDFLKGDDDEEF